MKTQVFKNSEPVKSSDSMMVFTMIIFWGLFLFAVDNMYILKSNTFNSGAKHENGLQLRKMNKPENAVDSENATTLNPGTEIELSMAKMKEYLIPENEPGLTIADANSIVFPVTETVVLTENKSVSNDDFLNDLKFQASEKTKEAVEYFAYEMKVKEYLIPETEPEMEASSVGSIVFPDGETIGFTSVNELSNDDFLNDLKIQASEKTKEAVELYAFEKKIKEYLTIETELPLQLEEWMTDRKCWCPELREAIAITQPK